MAFYGDSTNRKMIEEVKAKVELAELALPNVFIRAGLSGQFPTVPTSKVQVLAGMFYPKAGAGATAQTTISFGRKFKNAPLVYTSLTKSETGTPSFAGEEVWVSSSTTTNMVIRYYNPTEQEVTLGVNFLIIGELDDTPTPLLLSE